MITDYFEEKDIQFWLSGKNVTKGWVNIQCVFCNDHSNHLGVHLEKQYFHCWLCHEYGNVVKLIQQIEDCSFRRAQKIITEIWENDFSPKVTVGVSKTLPPSPRQYEVILPPILNKWPEKYLQYLRRRKFDPYYLIKKYKLMPAHRFGRYSHRIIVPFFVGKKLVTYTGMKTKEGQDPPYKDCSKKDCVIFNKETLYNINSVNNKVVIVEGVTDVWRIGDGAVALSTKIISDQQIMQLVQKDIREIMVLLDEDARSNIDKIVNSLLPIWPHVDAGYLEYGDPDEMSSADLLRVKKWLS